MKRLVLCGGHLSPALAVLEELPRACADWQPVYFGRKYALSADKALSLEYKTIHDLSIPFYTIAAGKMPRYAAGLGFLSVLLIPWGILQSWYYLLVLRPKVIVSFGGYVSFAVVVAGWLLRIPVVMHEQTPVLGLANRTLARMATVICLSFPDTAAVPKGARTVVTGNLLRHAIHTPREATELHFGDRQRPLLYITGGSLGSRAINDLVSQTASELVPEFRILHQCGAADGEKDYQRLLRLRETLPAEVADNYQVVTHLPPAAVGSVMRAAEVIVSRAGANTVGEIAQVGTPAVLIPLPWSADGEQEKNARLLAGTGLAVLLDQQSLSPDLLLSTVRMVYQQRAGYRSHAAAAQVLFPPDGVQRMVTVLSGLLQA